MKKYMQIFCFAIALVLSVSSLNGCSSEKMVTSSIDSQEYEVVSNLYILGARKGKKEAWVLTTPGYPTPEILNEFKNGFDPRARFTPWKIYEELYPGSRVKIHHSTKVNGVAFSGYQVYAEILGGEYKGSIVKLWRLVLTDKTHKPIESWDPYVDPLPLPDAWEIDSRYLKLADSALKHNAPM